MLIIIISYLGGLQFVPHHSSRVFRGTKWWVGFQRTVDLRRFGLAGGRPEIMVGGNNTGIKMPPFIRTCKMSFTD